MIPEVRLNFYSWIIFLRRDAKEGSRGLNKLSENCFGLTGVLGDQQSLCCVCVCVCVCVV